MEPFLTLILEPVSDFLEAEWLVDCFLLSLYFLFVPKSVFSVAEWFGAEHTRYPVLSLATRAGTDISRPESGKLQPTPSWSPRLNHNHYPGRSLGCLQAHAGASQHFHLASGESHINCSQLNALTYEYFSTI